jgi:hypothetical protein
LHRRLVMTLEMIREVEAEREQALQSQDDTASRTIQALRGIRGIGDNFAAVLTRSVLSLVREPPANRQLSRPYTFPERRNGSRSADQPGRHCEGAQDAHPVRLALAALSPRQQLGMLVPGKCRKFARAHPPHRQRCHGAQAVDRNLARRHRWHLPEGTQISRCDRLRHWELTLPAFRVGHIQPGSTPRA